MLSKNKCFKNKHEGTKSTKGSKQKAESLIYPSPMATPWGHDMQKPMCALKRQHTYMTSKDVFRQNQSWEPHVVVYGKISFREFGCHPEQNCVAGRKISKMLRFRFATLRMTTPELAIALSCFHAFRAFMLSCLRAFALFAPFYH